MPLALYGGMADAGMLDPELDAPPAPHAPEEGCAMGSWDPHDRRGRRRAHRRRAAAPGAAPAPPAPARPARGRRRREPSSAEEQALREARRAANRKMGFLGHFVPYAAVCLFLLFVAGFRAAMVVAFAWGIGIAIHFFFAVIAPDLRRRLLDQEIDRRVRQGVREERRSLEDRHTRHVQELSASLAHEIRNPITAAKSLVQQLGEDPGAHENVEYAKVALDELERVERSISHLLRFAREEDLRLEEVQLGEIVDAALEALGERTDAQGVAVQRDLEPVSLRADPEKLRRVVLNLARNALDALAETGSGAEGGSGRPRLRFQTGENLAGTRAWLRVRDNGPGMDADALARVWSPFVTSKDDGTGLGLAITRKLVEAHRGTVEAESRPGEGTTFVVTLPKDPEQTEEEA